MSIHTECREAAEMLLDDPKLRITTKGVPEVFTELDVVMLAARRNSHSAAEMEQARKVVSNLLGMLFRDRVVVRFGPVHVPGLPAPDYARVASKIAYGSPEGIEELVTPNGTFPRIFIHEDPIVRQGRRLGEARDDLLPWNHQDKLRETLERVAGPDSAARREIDRLSAELGAMTLRAEAAEAELHRLREHGAMITKDDIAELLKEHLRDAA